jgi:UDP-N-acetyl-D-glucosamine dehydrogenase
VSVPHEESSSERVERLAGRFRSRHATVGVVGLGYVGLPVAVAFAQEGFKVLGIDANPDRVAAIQQSRSHLLGVPDTELAAVIGEGRISASTNYKELASADAVLICVPTPLSHGVPDLSAVTTAGAALGQVLTTDTLVVLESTTYPGTTEELFAPLIEAGGLRVGSQLWLAYSPERIDPGNAHYGFRDIPKVVGGVDAASTLAAAALYAEVVPKVITVPGTREAELTKLIENTFRHVNIALVNELAMYAKEWNIDIWEAIEAASSKPFGFMPFWPSPGWGGHCIPLDPSYLSWRVRRENSHDMRFIELAQSVNAQMPKYVVDRVSWLLNDHGKALRDSKILGIGIAYKGGTEDTRGSPGLNVLESLVKKGADVAYHDPLVPEVVIGGSLYRSIRVSPEALSDKDIAVIFVPQVGIDWNLVYEAAPAILDCCNALGRQDLKVTRL